jgi:hypothetical protein
MGFGPLQGQFYLSGFPSWELGAIKFITQADFQNWIWISNQETEQQPMMF